LNHRVTEDTERKSRIEKLWIKMLKTDEPLLGFSLRALRDSVVPCLRPMGSAGYFGGAPGKPGQVRKRT